MEEEVPISELDFRSDGKQSSAPQSRGRAQRSRAGRGSAQRRQDAHRAVKSQEFLNSPSTQYGRVALDKVWLSDELNDSISKHSIAVQPLSCALPISLRGIGPSVTFTYNKCIAISNGKMVTCCSIQQAFRCCLAQLTAKLSVVSDIRLFEHLGVVAAERFRMSLDLRNLLMSQTRTFTFIANILSGIGCFEVDKSNFSTYVPSSISPEGTVTFTDAFRITAFNVRSLLLNVLAHPREEATREFLSALLIPGLVRNAAGTPQGVDDYFPENWFTPQQLSLDFVAFNELLAKLEGSKAPGLVTHFSYFGKAVPVALPSVNVTPQSGYTNATVVSRVGAVYRYNHTVQFPARIPWWTTLSIDGGTASRGLLSQLGERANDNVVRNPALAVGSGIFTWASLATEAVKT